MKQHNGKFLCTELMRTRTYPRVRLHCKCGWFRKQSNAIGRNGTDWAYKWKLIIHNESERIRLVTKITAMVTWNTAESHPPSHVHNSSVWCHYGSNFLFDFGITVMGCTYIYLCICVYMYKCAIDMDYLLIESSFSPRCSGALKMTMTMQCTNTFCLYFRLDLLRLNNSHCCCCSNILRHFECTPFFFLFSKPLRSSQNR